MSAIIPSSHVNDSNPTLIDHTTIREKLQENLLTAAKICHTRFGAKSELATESDKCVTQLCYAFEQILSHGVRYSNQTEKFNAALRYLKRFLLLYNNFNKYLITYLDMFLNLYPEFPNLLMNHFGPLYVNY